MFTDSKKQMIKLVIAITILIFVLVIVGILMIKYEVEGETNMPFKLSKVIVVGTVEGVENGESDKNGILVFSKIMTSTSILTKMQKIHRIYL